MAKSENQASQDQSKASISGRGISYPAISLGEAVGRALDFWQYERKNAAPLEAAATHWGYSPSSSGVRTLVAALLSYGLMVDRGSGSHRQVQLSERALDIILNTPERGRALIDAIKSPKIYAELLTEWNPKDLPSDQTIMAHLLRHKNFNPKAVNGFVKDFRASISFSGLDKIGNMPEAKTEAEGTMTEAVAERKPADGTFIPGIPKPGTKQVGAAIPVSPTCSISILADGEVTQDGLDKLKLYIDLIKGSFPKTSLEALYKESTENAK